MNFTPKKLALAAALMAAGTAFAAENQVSSSTTSGATAETSQAPAPLTKNAAKADESVRQLQQSLKEKGFDPGPIDGIMGPKTQAAQQQASTSSRASSDSSLSSSTPRQPSDSTSSSTSSSTDANSSSMTTTPTTK